MMPSILAWMCTKQRSPWRFWISAGNGSRRRSRKHDSAVRLCFAIITSSHFVPSQAYDFSGHSETL